MAEEINFVFRDWNTPGNPASGEYEPEKPRIRRLLRQIQGGSGQSVTRGTLAQLEGVTPPTEDYMGVVLADPDPANNGYYQRDGGVWVRGRGFPDTFAEMELSGSASAQTGSVDPGVNPADVEIFWADVQTENDGPLTLDGLPVLNVAGNALSAGEWVGVVQFVNRGDHWQLINDAGAAASAAQSASEAAADADRADLAADRAQNAASAVTSRAWFDYVSTLLADDNDVIGYVGSGADFEVGPGDIIEAQGFRYEVVASDATDFNEETAGGVKLKLTVAGAFTSALTVKIPSDFPTLQAAIDFYSNFRVQQGVKIILLIESGHQPTSGILVRDGDYGHFWIEAEDTITINERPNGDPINAGDPMVTADIGVVTAGAGFTGRFIQAINARAPVLNCRVDMNGEGPNGGYRLEQGSSGTVEMYGGIINSGGRNAEIVLSLFDADYTWWDGALERGVRVGNASYGRVRGASIQNCGEENLAIAGSSHVVAIDGVFSGSELDNIRVDLSSSCALTGAVAQNATRDNLVVANSSTAAVNRADFSLAGRNGVMAIEGSTIASNDPWTATGCGQYNLYARAGSTIVAANSDLSAATLYSVQAERGSTVVVTNSDISGSVRAINADGSTVEAANSNATGSTGDRSVFGSNGSRINFAGGTAASASGAAIRIATGSIVNAANATGSLSNTANAVTAAGIIFQ